MIFSGRPRRPWPESPSHTGLRTWLMALAACALGGCLLAYDYGEYRGADDGAGAAGSGGAATGGQSCTIDEEPANGCQNCIEDQCSLQLSQCSAVITCRPFSMCVIQCCEPACFTECNGLTTAEGKNAINECICTFCEEACNTVIPACP